MLRKQPQILKPKSQVPDNGLYEVELRVPLQNVQFHFDHLFYCQSKESWNELKVFGFVDHRLGSRILNNDGGD
jgi:hypothetical protein